MDFKTFAVENARLEFGRTHYVAMDSRPNAQGEAMAICGAMIPERESTALPTCQQCDAYWELLLRDAGIR